MVASPNPALRSVTRAEAAPLSFGYIALVVAVGGGACDQSGPLVGAGLHRREMAVPDEGPLPSPGEQRRRQAAMQPWLRPRAR